ncbi:hypothetical protein H8R18_01495 [Nanchangia anserum]|uniref:Tetratricopeptide repeat protein n=1 Tax=Nanchangia anserum TaxID=2692125 RepID=A0A8I0GDU8_9ACTO|nr:hypothetical protein [Nanchangia anserum]MBD3690146.1 hypothetical protein [Nanchangia anserum]QOX82075.1 hypothetical protein H8R18_01495 [Nanchangia anserum]
MAESSNEATTVLGLTAEDATIEAVRVRRDELCDYLAHAPRPLAEFAQQRADAIHAAAEELIASLKAREAEDADSRMDAEPATRVFTHASSPAEALAELGEEDDDDVYTSPSVSTPSVKRRAQTSRERETRAPSAASAQRSGAAVALMTVIGVVAVVVVVLAVYALGRPGSAELPENHPDTPASAAVDGELSPSELAEQIATLREQVDANPDDTALRTKLGIALFYARDFTGAKTEWDRVLAEEPNNPQVYYNLGFWYMSQEPPQVDKANEMWDKVIELAPADSELVETIKMHRSTAPLASTQSSSGSDAK